MPGPPRGHEQPTEILGRPVRHLTPTSHTPGVCAWTARVYTLRASRGEGSRENCAAHVSPPHLSPRTDSSHFSHSASAPSLSLGFPHSPLPPPPPRVPTRGQLTFPQLWQLQLLASLPPQPSPPPSDCHSCLLLFPALPRSS